MRTTRTDALKAAMTAAVYAVVGLVFFGEYPLVGAMFWALSIVRLVLYYRLRKRRAMLPVRDRSAPDLDTPEAPD